MRISKSFDWTLQGSRIYIFHLYFLQVHGCLKRKSCYGQCSLGMEWPATAVVTHKYNDKSEKNSRASWTAIKS